MGIACASLAFTAFFAHAATRPIPEVVNITSFAHVDGSNLDLLVRVPLAAVKDVQFPSRGDAGYLDLSAVASMLPGAARYWIAPAFDAYESGVALGRPEVVAARIAITDDPSFTSYQTALAHFTTPELPPEQDLFWNNVWLDVHLRYPLTTSARAIAIDPKVAGLGVRVMTTISTDDPRGDVRTFSFDGDPGLIYLDARWSEAARQFVRHGVRFVARGAEPLLLLFCLVLPFRRYRDVTPAIVLYLVALLAGLVIARAGLVPDAVWFRPLVGTLATFAILLTAFANIAGRVTPRRRALLALCTGVVYGISSAFALAGTIQFGGSHPLIATLAFYGGLAAAVLAIVAVVVPVVGFLFSLARIERLERIIVSALAADTAWGWLGDRWTELRRIPVQVVFDAGVLALTLEALAGAVLFAGLLWFVNEGLKSRRGADEEFGREGTSRTAR
jgi:hypothetical protein